MPDCTCRGVNPNCSRCGGTGFIGRLGDSREVSVSDVILELKAISDRPGRRARIPKKKQLPVSPTLATSPGSRSSLSAAESTRTLEVTGKMLSLGTTSTNQIAGHHRDLRIFLLCRGCCVYHTAHGYGVVAGTGSILAKVLFSSRS